MREQCLIVLGTLAICSAASAGNEMVVGDGQIDGRKIKPFEITWQQCGIEDEQWKHRGTVTEVLTPIGDTVLRLRRDLQQSSGITGVSTTYFDRTSFAPLRMESEFSGADGALLARSHWDINTDGYTGFVERSGEANVVKGEINSNMLAGSSMGLPLATVAYQKKPLEFLASMMNFDASYLVKANWVGKEKLDFEGQKIEAWLVDIEWQHQELGDVYPPGPDASGGRYWVVPEPPDGFPYVPRYKTDTYAVEFIEGVCPRT